MYDTICKIFYFISITINPKINKISNKNICKLNEGKGKKIDKCTAGLPQQR